MFTGSLVSVVTVTVLTDRSVAVLLAAAFGYVLSQDIFSNVKVLGYIISKCGPFLRLRSPCRRVFSKTFGSYSSLDFHPISDPRSYAATLAIGILKGVILLTISLVITHFAFDLSGGAEDLTQTIVASSLIALYVVSLASDSLQGVYVLRVFRNPLHPHNCENVEKFRKKRKLLSYISVPKRLTALYGE